jgi:hypothetical protein
MRILRTAGMGNHPSPALRVVIVRFAGVLDRMTTGRRKFGRSMIV